MSFIISFLKACRTPSVYGSPLGCTLGSKGELQKVLMAGPIPGRSDVAGLGYRLSISVSLRGIGVALTALNPTPPHPSPEISVYRHPCSLWVSPSAVSPVTRKNLERKDESHAGPACEGGGCCPSIKRGPRWSLSSLPAVGSLVITL